MNPTPPGQVVATDLPLRLVVRGKVRDVYEVHDEALGALLLIVATDRISAFDHILPTPIPDKGRILTQLAAFWFGHLRAICPNHLITTDPAQMPDVVRPHAALLDGRAMLVRRARRLDVECVVRGYLAGSGWVDYRRDGAICGVPLPAGLQEGARLPSPIFPPATKAESGHDENISEAEAGTVVGHDRIGRLKSLTLQIYARGVAHAETCGIIIADTKLEFGVAPDATPAGQLILIDELLTPDSSRFWPKAEYVPGRSQPSFDKQFVRDYLEEIGWNKQPPVPSLPDHVIQRTKEKYLEAYRRLTGRELTA